MMKEQALNLENKIKSLNELLVGIDNKLDALRNWDNRSRQQKKP